MFSTLPWKYIPLTVTENLQCPLLRAESQASYIMVVEPSGNVEPDARPSMITGVRTSRELSYTWEYIKLTMYQDAFIAWIIYIVKKCQFLRNYSSHRNKFLLEWNERCLTRSKKKKKHRHLWPIEIEIFVSEESSYFSYNRREILGPRYVFLLRRYEQTKWLISIKCGYTTPKVYAVFNGTVVYTFYGYEHHCSYFHPNLESDCLDDGPQCKVENNTWKYLNTTLPLTTFAVTKIRPTRDLRNPSSDIQKTMFTQSWLFANNIIAAI